MGIPLNASSAREPQAEEFLGVDKPAGAGTYCPSPCADSRAFRALRASQALQAAVRSSQSACLPRTIMGSERGKGRRRNKE